MSCNDRLFPISSSQPLLSGDQIKALAKHMLSADASTTSPIESTHKYVAGYTYLGQLIAHDIVPKTRPSYFDRMTTPSLNLDSIYGDLSDQTIYFLFDNEGRFQPNSSNSYDLYRGRANEALIPDPRNDENVIVAQLHRLWQQVHNWVIEDFVAPHCRDIKARIHEAKSIVTALFHLVVIEDFLFETLEPETYNCYFSDWHEYILQFTHPLTAIPLEFSHAAFRFGHSMTRARYILNQDNTDNPVHLLSLIRQRNSGSISNEHKIDWTNFFGADAQEAAKIDLQITSGMDSIPLEGNIVYLNLMAADHARIPSGYAVLDWLNTHQKTLATDINLAQFPEVTAGAERNLRPVYDELTDNFKNRTLPLWLYVLRESALSAYPDYRFRKTRLGKVGSVIVAEVLRQSIISCYLPNGGHHPLDKKTHLEMIKQCASEPYRQIVTQYPNQKLSMSNLITFISKPKG
ncbi:peroxidase family protein [Neptunicella sp. SCSIO 80796]|uniref:peroxidase family protein n=1 Tax=Neptunicella plasticusilytica TaxID=3117012 RepID=UPI003A4DC340